MSTIIQMTQSKRKEAGLDVKTLSIKLLPEQDVVCEEAHFVALSARPWLRIVPAVPFKAGRIIEITYRASLWDEPVRPIFRFWFNGSDFKDMEGSAPIAGAGSVSLEIPNDTSRMSVCPARETGRFDFYIEDIRNCTRPGILKKSLAEGSPSAWLRIVKNLSGFKSPLPLELDWGFGLTSSQRFPKWLQKNARVAELDGCDSPRCDWLHVEEIQLFLHLEPDKVLHCAGTIRSLQAQCFTRWRLNIVAAAGIHGLPSDPRVIFIAKEDAVPLSLSLSPKALIGSLCPGDELYPNALAMMAESQARHPSAMLFYGDECVQKADAGLEPILKPGWSPLLAQESAYLDQAVFLCGTQLEASKTSLAENGHLEHAELVNLQANQVQPLRQFVLKTPRVREISALAPPPPFASTEINPSAMIIIPTRDQTELLGRCLRGIFERTAFQNYSIIIVDNDSVELASKIFFKSFFGDKIVSVSHSPGVFNFSALCNAGASRRRPDVLVFLKNYVEIESEDWLTRLVAHALRPETGAVGPVALYHGAPLPQPLAAFMPFEKTAHEVLAVPADCLAVSRRKFLLNGGFDAANFPNALQNLDFCLRLKEQGFASRADPGIGVRSVNAPKMVPVREELICFETRWGNAMRDDPYFHPGLSRFFTPPGFSS